MHLSVTFALLMLLNQLAFPQEVSISKYIINAELVPSENLFIAQVEMAVKNKNAESISEINLLLSADEIESVKINGIDVKFKKDEDKLKISHNFSGNDSLKLFLSYKGKYTGKSSANIDSNCTWLLYNNWFPKVNSPNDTDMFTYELKMKVPDSITVVSSGKLIETVTLRGKKTFNYKMDFPTQIISISAAKYIINKFNCNGVNCYTYLYPNDDNLKDTLINSYLKVFEYYLKKFGSYPYEDFKIVETDRSGGYGPAYFLMLNKNVIKEQNIYSQFVLYHELAHQWWGNIVFPNKDGIMLSETMATYSVFDYWNNLGITNNSVAVPKKAFNVPFVATPEFSCNTFHRMNYHMIYEPETITYQKEENTKLWASHYKLVQLIKTIGLCIGKEYLDNSIKEFIQKYKFQSASFYDLVAIAENMSGKNLQPLVHDWIQTNKISDFAIADVEDEIQNNGLYKTQIEIKQLGQISHPVNVAYTLEDGEKAVYAAKDFTENKNVFEVETKSKIVNAEVDPEWNTLDANRINNYYPEKRKFTFLTYLPSITENNYFYYPSATYGLTDGVRLGLWMTNTAPFLDFINTNLLPAEWSTAIFYGVKSKKIGYHFDLMTSFGMPSHYWQWGGELGNYRGTENYKLELDYYFQKDLNHNKLNKISFSISRNVLYNLSYYDNKDFTKGTISYLNLSWFRSISSERYNTNIEISAKVSKSDFAYSKFTFEYQNRYSILNSIFQIRFFAGFIRGEYPLQKQIFLSGGVMPENSGFWFVDPDVKVSTQENLHINGDVNLIGFYGQHLKAKNGAGINLKLFLPQYKYINLFFDFGNVWNDRFDKLKYDAGLGLDFTFVKFDFPIYISMPKAGEKKLDFRWLLELKFSIF